MTETTMPDATAAERDARDAAGRLRAAFSRHGLMSAGQFEGLRGDINAFGVPRVALGRVDPHTALALADLLDSIPAGRL